MIWNYWLRITFILVQHYAIKYRRPGKKGFFKYFTSAWTNVFYQAVVTAISTTDAVVVCVVMYGICFRGAKFHITIVVDLLKN
mmetsp:Transcript_23575/g.36248  ORF Transcript_23575/g.36248 Transcript_23575/m.36248 type:complete len:83 (+) Transcript_23575:316-564(+)